ncbi:HSPB3 protein, partial [Certhia familiaris]|nr:HSPB3 protein [Certhia familiaris]
SNGRSYYKMVKTVICCQDRFAVQELEAHKLDHSLYAFPGPFTFASSDRRCIAVLSSQEEENTCFQVLLNVVQFHPEDIMSQFEQKGFISRNFTRQYKLPNGVENKDLSVVLCHDSILGFEIKNSQEKN